MPPFMTELFTIIRHATLELPAIEVTGLIIILTICLVLRFTRTGLVTAYLFVYRWGWIFFMGQTQDMLIGYFIFGCLVGILTVIGMLLSPP